ncbi:hypothetical protein JCM9279_004912 [Rhodotorula babjevae]
MPTLSLEVVEALPNSAGRRAALLCRLPAELLLEIARTASGPRDSYRQWLAWRRSLQSYALVCRYLRRVLEGMLCEVVWVSGSELAVDGTGRAFRPVRDRLGPLSKGKTPTRVSERVKWLRMDGQHHLPSGDDLVVRDFTPLPMLETLELERCALVNPAPFVHLTSLWLDTVSIRPVDFARLVTPALTPKLNYLALRSLADPDKVNLRHKGAPVVFFPDLPHDLLARLGLLQVDMSDVASFPDDLFAHPVPVVLTWRFWHQTPASLVFGRPERAPKHVQVGDICYPEHHALWVKRTCDRLLVWAQAAPLVRDDGDDDEGRPPRTLILPGEFWARYEGEDYEAGQIVENVVLECGRRGIQVEWAVEARWEAEKRLHGVLQRRQ